MSLNGNLEVFPLEEVLRLLARSRKSGCLRVESGGLQGRIFLNSGAMSLATVVGDEELRRRLVASGLVEESELRKVELSGSPVSESLAEGATPAGFTDFVREESVEGLYRIRRTGRGSFDFLMELSPRYPTGQSFDAEVIVSEADRRSLEWEDVESVLPSMDTVLRMVPVLEAEDTVTLNPATWRILAALGSGASITSIARHIGWSDFKAAREMASLYRNGLVTTDEYATAADVVTVAEKATEEAPVQEVAPAAAAAAVETIAEAPAEAPVEVLAEAPADGPAEQPAEQPVWASDGSAGVDEPAAADEPEMAEAGSPWSIEPEPMSDPEPAYESDAVAAEEPVADLLAAPELSEPETETAPMFEQASETPAPVEVETSSSWWSDEAAEPVVEPETAEEPATPWSNTGWTADPPAEEPAVQSAPWSSWRSGPDPDPGAAVDELDVSEVEAVPTPESPSEPETPSGGAEAGQGDRTGGWWAETMGGAEAEASSTTVDSDADRFLESVFSSLSDEGDKSEAKSEEEDDESGFGMGLLRRRRMGAAARDISDNNR